MEIKSLIKPNPAQQRLIYISNEDKHISINGSVDSLKEKYGKKVDLSEKEIQVIEYLCRNKFF